MPEQSNLKLCAEQLLNLMFSKIEARSGPLTSAAQVLETREGILTAM